MKLIYCPTCGKLISPQFPIHDCRPKRKRTAKPKARH